MGKRFLGVALLLAAVSPLASAFNLGFLKESPLAHMSEEDATRFQSALIRALESGPDGSIRHWENRSSGAQGEITLIRTYHAEGMTCRRFSVHNRVKGREGHSTLDACKYPDGRWRIRGGRSE